MSMTVSLALKYFQDANRTNDMVCVLPKSDIGKCVIKALEKQMQMERYCDENGCADCPYHNPLLKDNICMNDFIIDKE